MNDIFFERLIFFCTASMLVSITAAMFFASSPDLTTSLVR